MAKPKSNNDQIRDTAYHIAALADSSDHTERQHLAANLAIVLGLTAEQIADGQEARRNVNTLRSRRHVREMRQRAGQPRPQCVSDILTITGGGLQYDSQAFDLAPAALRGQVLEAMRQAVTA